MAGKGNPAPEDAETEEGEALAGAKAAGGSLFGRMIGGVLGMSLKKAIAGVVLLALIGGGGAFMFMGGDKEEMAAEEMAPKALHHELPELMVNLSAGKDRPQFLRVKITLELSDQKAVEALKPVMPRVMDTFQVHLRELRAADLEGSAGIFRLREELTRRVNHAIAPAKIRAVLFREVVVQ